MYTYKGVHLYYNRYVQHSAYRIEFQNISNVLNVIKNQ
jgi:hypothetical protein